MTCGPCATKQGLLKRHASSHLPAATIPSATVKGRTLYVPSHGITALDFPRGSRNAEQLWRAERLNPATV